MDRPDYLNSDEEFNAGVAKARAEHRSSGKPRRKTFDGRPNGAKVKAATDLKVTEDGAALEFAELYRDKLLFDHGAGAWYEWTTSHWKREGTGLALEWARQLARKLSDGQVSVRKTSFAGGVERFARVDRTFAVTADHWDKDPFLLARRGGPLTCAPAPCGLPILRRRFRG